MRLIKYLFLYQICFLMYSNVGYCQHKNDVPGPRDVVEILVPAKLSPQIILDKEILSSVHLNTIYKKLEREKLGGNYNFDFKIDTNGNVKSVRSSKLVIYKELNAFMNNKFIQYTWEPAHKKNCFSCKVEMVVYFNVFFHPMEKNIVISMSISNGKHEQLYFKRINPSRLRW
ncbi:hypothetical protein ACFSOV_17715 [Pedobacter petrophilus]|uniref:hypothetical protein n=2 Tax=Pedobacter petrophilus TaxID=1908241 RepID=UPI00363EA9DE